MKLTVMCADKPVVEAYVSEDRKEANINRLVPDPIEQPFGGDKLDLEWVYRFLKSRCYEDGRVDLEEVLAQTDISNNNPWEWVEITHGVTWEDFLWIRLPEETLTWEDVRWKR